MNRKPIPDFPGYEVTDDGEVFSLRRSPNTGKRPCVRLTPVRKENGYLVVSLKHPNGRIVQQRLHRLVLLTFVGQCPDGMEGRHLNGDKTDNRLMNLAWGTPKENGIDRIRHGTTAKGEHHGMAKLTRAEVEEIRSIGSKESSRELGRRFGVSKTSILLVRKRKVWT